MLSVSNELIKIQKNFSLMILYRLKILTIAHWIGGQGWLAFLFESSAKKKIGKNVGSLWDSVYFLKMGKGLPVAYNDYWLKGVMWEDIIQKDIAMSQNVPSKWVIGEHSNIKGNYRTLWKKW